MWETIQNVSIRSLLTIGTYEQDEGFRKLLSGIARQGMLIYGLLGIIFVVSYVALRVLIGNKTPIWYYSDLNPDQDLTLPDKSLILILCLIIIYLSRASFSLNWRRLILSLFIWMICLAMVFDDIAARQITFATASYITIALIMAVGTIPYKGWQTGLLTLSVIFSILFSVSWVPVWFGRTTLEFDFSTEIYFFLIAFLLTGMSSQIYLNRYEQYRARRRAEQLGKELEERARKLKLLKEKSEKQARQLLENEKIKDRFFANISHEFRTPLTLILGPVKDILHDTDDEREENRTVGTEVLHLIYNNGRRLLDLINQLLDLSKLESENIRFNPEIVDLTEYLPRTVRSFASLAESRGIRLSCQVGPGTFKAEIDPQQMERVIGNLISNAIKFTPGGGAVTVTLSHESKRDGQVQIAVHDTGIGIPQKDLPKIFDRFYQADHRSDIFNPGTGIGLAFVKEMVEYHNGTIRAISKPGEGSEFLIMLPGADRSAETKSPGDGSDASSEGWANLPDAEPTILERDGEDTPPKDAPLVLLVDDNPDILDYLRPRLSTRYQVIATESSAKALQVIRDKPVELIVSDVMMPEPDGFEFCRLVKEDPELNHIPVILLTALAAEQDRIEGLEHGADDYISKPFSASELMVRAENLIELRKILREKYSDEVRIKGKEVTVSSEDARFIQQVQSVIEQHMEDGNFGVDWLAGEVNLSSRQLQRKVRSITGLSAGGYIRQLRLERAGQLLEHQWGNISEIAYKVGFQDSKYFSRLFKQTFGVNPSDYLGESMKPGEL